MSVLCAIRGSVKRPICKSTRQRIVRPRPTNAVSATRPLVISLISTLTWPLIATSGKSTIILIKYLLKSERALLANLDFSVELRQRVNFFDKCKVKVLLKSKKVV